MPRGAAGVTIKRDGASTDQGELEEAKRKLPA
jgi:hypothetical protein